MGTELNLTITINFPDGREIHDIETKADTIDHIPGSVEEKLREYNAEGYSSLVIVVVPKAPI